MIIDAHCHAWRRWPYDTAVPDPEHRGSIDALLYEMDTHGVDHATVVCARIGGGAGGDGFANDDNNDYVVDAARRHPDRITAWVDVDCVWRPEHHTPGAAQRLTDELARTGASGFTHYVATENDGWFASEEGEAFFAAAEDAGAIASLAVGAAWFDDLGRLAARHPRLPILIHHMSTPRHGPHREDDIAALLALADHDGVGVKISGFNYNAVRDWDFPHPVSQDLFGRIRDAFGPRRLHWGSDFPASRDAITYTQALEVVREHVGLSGTDLDDVLGDNTHRLITDRS